MKSLPSGYREMRGVYEIKEFEKLAKAVGLTDTEYKRGKAVMVEGISANRLHQLDGVSRQAIYNTLDSVCSKFVKASNDMIRVRLDLPVDRYDTFIKEYKSFIV